VKDERVLNGWKAVAAYVGHTEKTCRKWERELGLPVHRLEDSPKARVFAYADELDRWRDEKLQPAKVPEEERFPEAARKPKLRLIAVSSLIVLALVVLLVRQVTRRNEATAPPGVKSVAILPFTDLTPEKDYEYLCDGMAGVLINALGKIGRLRVPAWTSASYFKGKDVSLQEMGRMLKVEAVLEGSLKVEGERMRVIPRLLNVADGHELWSEKYNRSRGDLFAVQDDIARGVVRALRVKLLGEKEEITAKRNTADREAYVLYLKGRYLWEKRLPKDMLKAIDFFQEAVDRDPEFALAFAGLADCYHALGTNQFIAPGEAYSKGKAAALKAIEIDQNLAEARASLATILFYFERDFSGAEKEFQEAIRINPAYANAHHWYAAYLSSMGRHDEARKEIFLARELDPLSPRVNANVGSILIYARQYDRALEELDKALELFPDHFGIVIYRWWAYAFLGQPEKGIEVIVDYCKKQGIDYSGDLLGLGYLYARAGNHEEARRRLNLRIESSKKIYRSPIIIAQEYIALGDKNEAIAWLEKAFAEEEPRLADLKVSPFFDPLRSDPRFTDLLRRIGFKS
jgi:TolB-like protein/Tfp pilus assembly protein PilF